MEHLSDTIIKPYLPVPFLGFSQRISKRLNTTLLLPIRFETKYKFSKTWHQSLFASLNNRSAGVVNFTEFKESFPNAYYDSFNFKFGTNAFLQYRKESQLIISAGYMTRHEGNIYIDAIEFGPLNTDVGIFLKVTLLSDLQKSLISTRGILQSFE